MKIAKEKAEFRSFRNNDARIWAEETRKSIARSASQPKRRVGLLPTPLFGSLMANFTRAERVVIAKREKIYFKTFSGARARERRLRQDETRRFNLFRKMRRAQKGAVTQ